MPLMAVKFEINSLVVLAVVNVVVVVVVAGWNG